MRRTINEASYHHQSHRSFLTDLCLDSRNQRYCYEIVMFPAKSSWIGMTLAYMCLLNRPSVSLCRSFSAARYRLVKKSSGGKHQRKLLEAKASGGKVVMKNQSAAACFEPLYSLCNFVGSSAKARGPSSMIVERLTSLADMSSV